MNRFLFCNSFGDMAIQTYMNFDFFLFVHWSRLYAGILCFYLSRPNCHVELKVFFPSPFKECLMIQPGLGKMCLHGYIYEEQISYLFSSLIVLEEYCHILDF